MSTFVIGLLLGIILLGAGIVVLRIFVFKKNPPTTTTKAFKRNWSEL